MSIEIPTLVPSSSGEQHIKEAHSLAPDPYVDLFELYLPSVDGGLYLRFSPKEEVKWDNQTWVPLGCDLTGLNTNTSGEAVRPKFQIMNPSGVFSLYVAQGKLDNATLKRYRVLYQHLLAGQVISLQYYWKVGRVLNLTRSSLSLELRAFFDGQPFTIPIRQYFPPDFTHVDLG